MTGHLYQTESYLKAFDAVVTATDGQLVSLDQTAFYPGGGGQPPDRGSLAWDVGSAHVAQVKRQGAEVWHTLDGQVPTIGSRVRGILDWEWRYRLMRTHTALHVLCGVVWRDYGASVTGGNMEPLKGRMDFEFEHMRKELVQEIEEKVNVEVAAGRALHVRVLPREEAFQIPDLIRTKINLLPPHIAEVRVVEIEGLDMQADGGTHVANTAELGPLRIVDYKSKGRINKRLVLALEKGTATNRKGDGDV